MAVAKELGCNDTQTVVVSVLNEDGPVVANPTKG
jgi:hypothetical protein